MQLIADRSYNVYVAPDDPTVDFDLAIYDDEGNRVSQDRDEAADAFCSIEIVRTSLFTLEVTSARGASAFTVTVALVDEATELRSGDDELQYAFEIAAGELQDFDVVFAAGTTHTIMVQPDDRRADLDLAGYDDAGNLVAIDEGAQSDAACTIAPAETAPFHLVVAAASGPTTYSLTITEVSGSWVASR